MLLTLLLELPVVLAGAYGSGVRWQRALVVGVLASCLTHPLAWSLAWLAVVYLATPDYLLWLLGIEASVVLVEAWVFRHLLPLPWGRALVLSVLANGLSALTGLLL